MDSTFLSHQSNDDLILGIKLITFKLKQFIRVTNCCYLREVPFLAGVALYACIATARIE